MIVIWRFCFLLAVMVVAVGSGGNWDDGERVVDDDG